MASATTFDLDINNYTISDLASFLKLSPNYDENELKEREKTMTMSILSLQADTTYKYDIIEFIKKAVLVCSGNFRASELSNNNMNTDKYNPNIRELRSPNPSVEQNGSFSATGKIVNPYSTHPALQTQSIPLQSTNGYNYNTFVTNYVFNTRFRDNFFNSSSTNCSFVLPKTLKNVIAISLSGLQFPNTFFTFSKSRYTTQIYIQEDDTGNKGIVVIPEGNYSMGDFPGVLQNCINDQILGGVARFNVSIDPYTRFVTLSNTTYTFSMKLITPYKNNVGVDCLATNFKVDGKDVKEKVMPSSLYNTLGYQIGFRNIFYKGKKSYTSESTYSDKCMDYFYFSLNDFTNNQVTSTYGVLPQSLLDKNILAVVPLTTSAFEFSFDNNSNEIYKTRNYVGPVDISKVSMQLLDSVGTVLDIHQNEITFCLQVTCIYDNTIPYADRSVSII
jgi:hypothetical protein